MPSRSHWQLDPSVKELLEVGLEHKIKAHIEQWTLDVANGICTEEARLVFVALGWIGKRDVRLKFIEDEPEQALVSGKRTRKSDGTFARETIDAG